MSETNSALVTFQSDFCAFLLAAELQPSAGLLTQLTGTPATTACDSRTDAGLRVYRNNVIHSLSQVLAAQFPVVRKLVGAEFFAALARDYVRKYPPTSAELTYYGQEFGTFLNTIAACRPLPYLCDVANLELQCQRSLHAADDPVLARDELQAIDPEQLAHIVFTLHASAALFTSEYPIDRIWAANLEDSQEEIRLETNKQYHMLIYRHDLQIYVVTLQPEAFTLLQQLQASCSLEQACEYVMDQYSLDPAELTPLLSYLLGLNVFSSFTLPSGKETT